MGEYAAAEEYKKNVITLAEELSPELLPEAYRDLAVIHEYAGNSDAALSEYQRSNELYRRQGNLESVARNLSEMGRIALRKMDNYARSLFYLEEALALLDLSCSLCALGSRWT